ncbi:MAG: hypothetical protein LQ351_007337 [Letrouitia transgressa]|nr:MAG: hypothetical protein LQ351_007337 [Letrouitia transgressa]
MAKMLRWRVLANQSFSVRQTDLILGGESLMKLAELMKETIAQASIAILGLTYSWDGGTNSTGIVTSRGSVIVPKLDCYYDDGRCYTTPDAPTEAAPFLAHTYGETASSLFGCPYTTDEDIFQANQSCTYFYNTAKPEFAYRYLDFNPNDVAGVYPYLTKRLIKASPGECSQYETFRGRDERDRYGLTLWHFNDGAENKTISIPLVNTAFDSTTYIYNDTVVPQDSIDQACGPRCLYIYALRQQGPRRDNTLNTLFQCQINITNVTSVGEDVHILADRNARLAAASIALTGRYTNLISREVKEWRQYQLYPFGSFWETDTLSATDVGSLIAQFAIGSLSVMARVNPPTRIPSPRSPTLGYHLSVHWNFFLAILATISAVHFLLMCATVFLSRPVVVGDDSNLVAARVLHGLVGRLGGGGKGGLLDGREIAAAIEQAAGGEEPKEMREVVYGVKEEEGKLGKTGRKVLEVGDEDSGVVGKKKGLPGNRFPRGEYA